MMVMGPTSSMFDVLTISMLLLLFQADVAFFRTGWFVETLATQILWTSPCAPGDIYSPAGLTEPWPALPSVPLR